MIGSVVTKRLVIPEIVHVLQQSKAEQVDQERRHGIDRLDMERHYQEKLRDMERRHQAELQAARQEGKEDGIAEEQRRQEQEQAVFRARMEGMESGQRMNSMPLPTFPDYKSPNELSKLLSRYDN